MDYFATDQLIEPEKGDLLISEPYLPDPNFERTVILLCEHDENGSFGFVLNKPSNSGLSELIEEAEGFDSTVYVGGPVQQNTLHFLHKSPNKLASDKEIVNGVYWGVDFDNLLTSINTKVVDENDLKFFIGYSGWSDGQLLDELKAKSWIVYKKATPELVFDMNPEELWREALQNMGGKYRVISNYPTDPRLN
ncbi:YqgE/AlgH family protein [Marinoscillum pacificum]|uniref:YqgE/AlgH family protein n=1 Tax=Marinoscillum pacificum TaxID=392723 RepID=UPI002156F9CC|nr:YqgE/AlgH family protein [Marinoscillum pacificum]